MRRLKDLVKPFLDFNDPRARIMLFGLAWKISLFMLVLGYLLIVYFLFFVP